METVNPIRIKTEKDLEVVLTNLGYIARPVPFKNVNVIRDVSDHFNREPCLWLMAEENDLDAPCIISAENRAIYIYHYDDYNDLFRVWNKFTEEIKVEDFVKAIKSATDHNQRKKRLGY